MSKKVELAEQLQKEFEDLLTEKERSKFSKRTRAINEEIIEKQPKSSKELRQIIDKHQQSNSTSIKMFSVLNGVINKMLNPETRKSRKVLKPLDTLMRAYNVNNPKSFAKSMYKMTSGQQQSQRNKAFRPVLLSYYDGLTENIETEQKQAQRALRRADLERVSGMFKDLEDLRRERVPARQIKRQLIKKYNDPARVKRALNTELHEQAERVKLEQSQFLGYTHKKWNTQKDERVRKTKFHNQVAGKVVPINSNFRAAGLEAEYPSDLSLPIQERINCRCFVTYHNENKATPTSAPIIVPPRPRTRRQAQVRPQTYQAGETFLETKENMQKINPQFKFSRSLLSVKQAVVKKGLDNLGPFIERYDIFKDDPLTFEADLFQKKDFAFHSSPPLKTVVADADQRTSIVLNKHLFTKDPAVQRFQVKTLQEKNHFMQCDPDKRDRYILEHEFGHHIQHKLKDKHYQNTEEGNKLRKEAKVHYLKALTAKAKNDGVEFNRQKFLFEEANRFFDEKSNEYYIDIAVERYLEKKGIEKNTRNATKAIVDNTSEYGLVNINETFAEHWASYRLNTENPNELSVEFGKVIEEYLEGLNNGN